MDKVKAKKHLGQHFLKDESIAQDIADSLTLQGYTKVLEIGPGMGVLTKYLLQKDQRRFPEVQYTKHNGRQPVCHYRQLSV
jgi:16S rRNA (adenine1518-N6/adenine1519-N6)-dimethyltransferase